MKFQLGILLTAALAFGQKEIPKEDWTENGTTYNLPRWCQAEDANGYKKNCGVCDMACGQPSNYKCGTHCKKGACKCAPHCIPTGHLHHANPLDPRLKSTEIARGDGAKALRQWAATFFFERYAR